MLESRRLDSIPRNSYGIPMSEAMDPKNQFKVKVHGPRMDFVADKVNREQKAYREQYKQADMSVLHWAAEISD